jgi:hypothetical protein
MINLNRSLRVYLMASINIVDFSRCFLKCKRPSKISPILNHRMKERFQVLLVGPLILVTLVMEELRIMEYLNATIRELKIF